MALSLFAVAIEGLFGKQPHVYRHPHQPGEKPEPTNTVARFRKLAIWCGFRKP